jgi:exopolysaccharide biosynthesis protein
MRRLAISLCILASLAVAACASGQWQPVAAGVDYQRVQRDGVDVHITRADLRNPAVRVVATSEAEHGMTVSEFARKKHAIVAINADYFDEQTRPIGLTLDACGVWTRGQKVPRKEGLVAFGQRLAEIQRNTMKPRRWMTAGVSGWPMLNQGCDPIAKLPGSDHFTRAPHPRTAVGLSKSGRTAYFVVAEGRQEDVGGMTLPELAAFMDDLGACTAMNLDGGGSSAMWIEDRIVNRPSDGVERKVGNHLAIVAAKDFHGCESKEKD